MDSNLKLYKAYVENVHELEIAWGICNKVLNSSISRNNQEEIRINTKLLAFIQTSLFENLFYKVIYTPYGFSDAEIKIINRVARKSNITDGWKKCIELGLNRVKRNDKGTYNNIKKKLEWYVNNYVLEPIQVRNKIAHGQWTVCLNSEGNAINNESTLKIQSLDCILIDKWKDGFSSLANIIEIMIESPKKHFYHNLYEVIAKHEAECLKKEKWTFESKKINILKKKGYRYLS